MNSSSYKDSTPFAFPSDEAYTSARKTFGKSIIIDDITEMISTIDSQKLRLSDLLKTVNPEERSATRLSTDQGNITELIKKEKKKMNKRISKMSIALTGLKTRCNELRTEMRVAEDDPGKLLEKAFGCGYTHTTDGGTYRNHKRNISDTLAIRRKILLDEEEDGCYGCHEYHGYHGCDEHDARLKYPTQTVVLVKGSPQLNLQVANHTPDSKEKHVRKIIISKQRRKERAGVCGSCVMF